MSRSRAPPQTGPRLSSPLTKYGILKSAPVLPCFVLSNVTIERAEDETFTATGGKHHLYCPWRLDDGTLTSLGFRYQVPDLQAEVTELAVAATSLHFPCGDMSCGPEIIPESANDRTNFSPSARARRISWCSHPSVLV